MKYSIILILTFCSTISFSQQKMYLHKKNGNVEEKNASEVKELNFFKPNTLTIDAQGGKTDISFSDIDSIRFFKEGTDAEGYSGSIIDVDGNIYKLVQIGNQIWTAENLKSTKLNDGTDISVQTGDSEFTLTNTAVYCHYENTENNFGLLYNWVAVSSDKLCPDGFRVPSKDDWNALITFIEETGNRTASLKASSGWGTTGNGDDHFKFSALPGGCRVYDGIFYGIKYEAAFWSSTSASENDAYRFRILHCDCEYDAKPVSKNYGYSVRCVK